MGISQNEYIGLGCDLVIQHLPIMHKALSLISITITKDTLLKSKQIYHFHFETYIYSISPFFYKVFLDSMKNVSCFAKTKMPITIGITNNLSEVEKTSQ